MSLSASLEGEPSPDTLAARVAATSVIGLDGAPLRVRDVWRRGPVVTTFVRQYGCLFCHQAVDASVALLPRLEELGAELLVVGNGSLEQARAFYAERRLPRGGVTVVTDPGRRAYAAAELERSFTRTFLDRNARRAYGQARREGHAITGWMGDLIQLGGTLVTAPPARLVLRHASRHAGDDAPEATVLAAVREAAGRPS